MDCQVKKSEGDADAVAGGEAVTFMENRTKPAPKTTKAQFFVVDSGYSDHLVNYRSYLYAARKLKEPFVVDVANNEGSLVG